ncbi:hypothetical protein BDF21DRAFT_320206, partial [Thamnidium elegans]
MPPVKGHKRAYLNGPKSENNRFIVTKNLEDWEEMSTDGVLYLRNISRNVDQILKKSIFDTLRDIRMESSRSLVYKKTSRTTLWRNRKEAVAVNDRQKLTCFGFTTSSSTPSPVTEEIRYTRSEIELIRIRSMLAKLEEFIKPVLNTKHEGSNVDSYNFLRYHSISCYFLKRLEGKKVGEASLAVAALFWKKNNKSYRVETIVGWANEFLREGELSNHSQGVHTKRTSFLNDSDIKMMILDGIRKTNPAERSLVVIKKYIEEVVAPSVLGVQGRTISSSTISKYLQEWGYLYRKNEKTIYFDGHEREDVVKYRDLWSRRMLEYMEKMDFYSGENEENIPEPELQECDKKFVFVTQDESTF